MKVWFPTKAKVAVASLMLLGVLVMTTVAYWMGRMAEQRARERGDTVLVAETRRLRWVCLNAVSNLNEAMVTAGVTTNGLPARSIEDVVDELILGIVPWLTSDTGFDAGVDAKSITPEISGVLKRVDFRRGGQGRDESPTEKMRRVDAILRNCRHDWRGGGDPQQAEPRGQTESAD